MGGMWVGVGMGVCSGVVGATIVVDGGGGDGVGIAVRVWGGVGIFGGRLMGKRVRGLRLFGIVVMTRSSSSIWVIV